jgi:hypothetical protein
VTLIAGSLFLFLICCVQRPSMERDQESQADAEYDERNEKVTVPENAAEFFEFGHGALWFNRLAQP